MEAEVFKQFDLLRAVPAKEERLGAEVDDQDREQKAKKKAGILPRRAAPRAAYMITRKLPHQNPPGEQNGAPDDPVLERCRFQRGRVDNGMEPQGRRQREREDQCIVTIEKIDHSKNQGCGVAKQELDSKSVNRSASMSRSEAQTRVALEKSW